ncbi:hypothetical protein [Pengzhenrongella sp.]|jgi:hypothetical protein
MTETIGRLGKLPAVHDPRTLRLADYLTDVLPVPAPAARWTRRVHD